MPDDMEQAPLNGLITKVERQPKRRDRYNIFIEEQYAFSVFEDTLIKYRLYKGQHVDGQQLRDILYADELQSAYAASLRAISSRMKTERELLGYLERKGYGKEIAEDIVGRLKSQGYIDDQEFAHALTQYRAFSQKKGRLFIKNELIYKGISKQEVAKALDGLDTESEYEQALQLAVKKWSRIQEPSIQDKRKVAGLLLRRGYPGSIVSEVIKQLSITKNAGSEEMDWIEPDID
ncbi:RecX family transcriptional regulator [Paenibacillus thalictri]|uniref:Regulatory protein RecX n=1 Tax=Paenibacillus thalictri TaxID=2527873 RepID=A0A4Q9DQE3_9BACL|nr:RecX family transcriptional regulator [Paenibacillus thalictri]TBL77803.1 recombinase RecX [Paenibacillus thalictri]